MQYLDFTEMPVWQQGNDAVKLVYQLCLKLPKTEIFALADQMKRAAVSIPANIAEAFGRTGSKDKINFYVYARGSAFELRSHILIALNLGFFTQSEISSVEEVLKNITLAINKIIKGFQHPHP